MFLEPLAFKKSISPSFLHLHVPWISGSQEIHFAEQRAWLSLFFLISSDFLLNSMLDIISYDLLLLPTILYWHKPIAKFLVPISEFSRLSFLILMADLAWKICLELDVAILFMVLWFPFSWLDFSASILFLFP